MANKVTQTVFVAALVAASGGAFVDTSAQADSGLGGSKIAVSAPDVTYSGEQLTIRCKAPRQLAGRSARVYAPGEGYLGWFSPVKVSKSGKCSGSSIASAPGEYMVQVRIRKGGKMYKSNSVSIQIKP